MKSTGHYAENSFFLILVLTLAAAVFFVLPRLFSLSLWPDEALYAWLGKQVAVTPQAIFSKEFVEKQPPLFSLYLSLANISSYSDHSLRMLCVLAGLASIVAGYYLGKIVGGSSFLGAFCALGIGFGGTFMSVLPRMLPDIFQILLFTVLVILLGGLKRESGVSRHIWIGLIGVGAVLLKWSGLLCLPLIIIAYLILSDVKARQKVWIPVLIVILTTLFLLTNNFFVLGRFFPDVTALKGWMFTAPPSFYVMNIQALSPYPFSLGLLFIGMYVMVRSKHPKSVLILLWFHIMFVSVSLAGEKDLRYGLLFVPALLLIMAIGVEGVVKAVASEELPRYLLKWLLLAVFFILFLFQGIRFSDSRALGDKSYVGFKPAGKFVGDLVKAEGRPLVLTESSRAIRYYSGLNYREYGGPIRMLPRSIKELKHVLLRSHTKVILVIDRWQYTQPEWAYPLNDEKISLLTSLGFRAVDLSDSAEEGLVTGRPVVWLFVWQGNNGVLNEH